MNRVGLDRNGYAPSIIQDDVTRCFLCERRDQRLDRHEIFGGALRDRSKRLGLWVTLCHERCHIFGRGAVHNSRKTADWLKGLAREAAKTRFGWTDERFDEELLTTYRGGHDD